MKQNGSDITFAIQIAGVIVLTAFIALPVYRYIQRADNIGDSLSQDRLASFISEKTELPVNQPGVYVPTIEGAGISAGQQTAKYGNVGAAILSVSLQNITRLSADDFKKIGETPWSLMNTVSGNIAAPGVIAVVFNNANVVNGFMNRASTKKLTSDSQVLEEMIKNNDPVIERFFNNSAVKSVLDNEPLMRDLETSLLFTELIGTPAAQYFIQSPGISKNLVEKNRALAPLKQNEKLKRILLGNPNTARAAKAVYGPQ